MGKNTFISLPKAMQKCVNFSAARAQTSQK